ncbi:MAG: AMP-binding protein [Gammaproteobacteria bacterium]|nr:AMP-binding protein [Gammaproteobacteria bacterium]
MPEETLPAREQCVVREMLIRQAAARPDADFMLFDTGERWTYPEALSRARGLAAALERLGVRQGDFVLSWQGNTPTAVATFLALNFLGAVYVPINTSYRGQVLAHVVRSSGARLMIADGRLVERLASIDRAALEAIVVLGGERPSLPGIRLQSEDALSPADAGSAPAEREIAPWDTQMIIYTSGTTGPSKGVLSSHIHSYTAAKAFRNVGPGDRNLMLLPMFHVGGPYAVLWALIHGGSAVLVESFSVSRFWETVRRYEITTVGLLGAMAQFLLKQPPAPEDRDHPLRSVLIAPFDESAIEFGRRFAVPTYTEFNMTELSVPLFVGPNPTVLGSCGKPRAGVELRLVDEHDIEVPSGASGELLVRMSQPWTISHGYHNDPEATARAWRNGWFHTGDLFRRDAEDNYFFVDRLKDALRRRGENISSFEVESAILEHPRVREAAVVPVPGAGSEDDVLAVVALVPGAALEPAELIDFLRDKLAYFMIPRYLRVLDELPRTPTQKVEKHRLRREAVTADTWDREAAGIRIERDRLGAR